MATKSKSMRSAKRKNFAAFRQIRLSGKLLSGIAKRIATPGVNLINKREGVPRFTADPKNTRRIIRHLKGRKVRGRFTQGRFRVG